MALVSRLSSGSLTRRLSLLSESIGKARRDEKQIYVDCTTPDSPFGNLVRDLFGSIETDR